LEQMRKEGYITQEQENEANQQIASMIFDREKAATARAIHFVEEVKQILKTTYGFSDQDIETGGLSITTTLDYSIQKDAEAIVKEEIEKIKNLKVSNGAAVVSNPKNGDILAMVGSVDYSQPEFGALNVTIRDGAFQPGSTLKPIVYAAALQKGYTPATLLWDVRTEFPDVSQPSGFYVPLNYDPKKFAGPVQMRFALANSLNIPAVKMLAMVGMEDAMRLGYDMGIQSWEPTPSALRNSGLSLVLGGRETTLLDITTAYGVFATGGVRHNPRYILSIVDAKGNTVFSAPDSPQGARVLDQGTSYLISHMLLDPNARAEVFGTRSFLDIAGRTVAVKTGTTDEKKDNWTIGYTPSYVVGVWVGNNDRTPMDSRIASGVTGASPIWNKIMTRTLKGTTVEDFVKPDDVAAVTIDSQFGGIPFDNRPTRSEFFLKGTEPSLPSPVYQKFEDKIYFVPVESDPVSTDDKNRWQEGIQNWIRTRYSAADWQWYPPQDLLKKLNLTIPTPTP